MTDECAESVTPCPNDTPKMLKNQPKPCTLRMRIEPLYRILMVPIA